MPTSTLPTTLTRLSDPLDKLFPSTIFSPLVWIAFRLPQGGYGSVHLEFAVFYNKNMCTRPDQVIHPTVRHWRGGGFYLLTWILDNLVILHLQADFNGCGTKHGYLSNSDNAVDF